MANCRRIYRYIAIYIISYAWLHCEKIKTPESQQPRGLADQNRQKCGGKVRIEQSPLSDSLINPIAESVVAEVFAQTSSHFGRWKAEPFHGYSDHALFAARELSVPTVQLCHVQDRYNHSAADTVDKVSAVEMSRSVATAASILEILDRLPYLDWSEVRPLVCHWCNANQKVAKALAASAGKAGDLQWSREFLASVAASHEKLRDGGRERGERGVGTGHLDLRGGAHPRVIASWNGPFNTRAMLSALPDALRGDALRRFANDKSLYAVALNIALAINDERTWSQVVDCASYRLRRPIRREVSELMSGLLQAADWIRVAA